MTYKRVMMAPIVEMMRWVTRLSPRIAQPIVRRIADNEIIACGLRAPDGGVRVIYSPETGRRNHRVVRLVPGKTGQAPVTVRPVADYIPGLVVQVALDDARIGERYRVLADGPDGRVIPSPVITIKPRSRQMPGVRAHRGSDGRLHIGWQRPPGSEAMIYFVGVDDGSAPLGVYTRERFFNFPDISSTSLAIGAPGGRGSAASERYQVRMVTVDYEGWVPALGATGVD